MNIKRMFVLIFCLLFFENNVFSMARVEFGADPYVRAYSLYSDFLGEIKSAFFHEVNYQKRFSHRRPLEAQTIGFLPPAYFMAPRGRKMYEQADRKMRVFTASRRERIWFFVAMMKGFVQQSLSMRNDELWQSYFDRVGNGAKHALAREFASEDVVQQGQLEIVPGLDLFVRIVNDLQIAFYEELQFKGFQGLIYENQPVVSPLIFGCPVLFRCRKAIDICMQISSWWSASPAYWQAKAIEITGRLGSLYAQSATLENQDQAIEFLQRFNQLAEGIKDEVFTQIYGEHGIFLMAFGE